MLIKKNCTREEYLLAIQSSSSVVILVERRKMYSALFKGREIRREIRKQKKKRLFF
jgi:hypothetical protein